MAETEEIHEDPSSRPLWPEDTVEYRLYPTSDKQDELTKLAVDYTHYAKALSRGHLWNFGEFLLRVWTEDREGEAKNNYYPAHLYGRTCFRDNVEDEWLIVYLLYALSKHNQRLVISVADSDGQFLLIQAAHFLPKWLKPETATNRIFIHDGQLHIIPKPSTPAEITQLPVATPTMQEAVRLVVNPQIPTVASNSIQTAIRSRIKCFSGSFDYLYHRVHCYLPFPAAHVISHDPQLLPAAIHALCDRLPSDTSLLRNTSVFSPSKHSSLTVPVQFTKLLYAKLVHERFSAPRNSGFSVPPAGAPDHRSHDLGMKVTCGLELLVRGVKSASCEGGVVCDPKWTAFVTSLTDKGYFQGEIEGSKGHRQLMDSAKEYFTQSARMEKSESNVFSAGQRVLHILQNIPYTEEELRGKWAEIPPPDDDSWLELSHDDLDAMIRQAGGYNHKSTQDQAEGSKVNDSEELDLESLVFGMRSFVDKVSSHKGAEFPWTDSEPAAVNFDPDSFFTTLQGMLDQSVARQPSQGSDSEDTLSGDDLSISSEECVGGGASGDGEDPSISQLMSQMDLELAQTELGKSFEKAQAGNEDSSKSQSEGLQPVDVDFNLVKNLLDSYSSQGGGAGPASNILSSLGVHVPEQ